MRNRDCNTTPNYGCTPTKPMQSNHDEPREQRQFAVCLVLIEYNSQSQKIRPKVWQLTIEYQSKQRIGLYLLAMEERAQYSGWWHPYPSEIHPFQPPGRFFLIFKSYTQKLQVSHSLLLGSLVINPQSATRWMSAPTNTK